MNKRKIRKENRGITLIALVITIIVLLILAGVAIATLTGDNGILNQAGNSKEATKKAQAEEEVNLALANLRIEESQRNMTQDEKVEALLEDLRQFYPEQQPASTVSMEGTGFLINHRGYEFNDFDAKEWDKTATPEDCFYWESDNPNDEGYGKVIGYTEKIENYPKIRFPSRCTQITLSSSLDYDGVTAENSRAFTNNILKAEIPGTLTSIGDWAFGHPAQESFQKLEEVVIEYGLTSIGEGAFHGCTSLDSIIIPSSVTSIGRQAFGYCTNLSSITIPNSVTTIGERAFYSCRKLSNITISDNVTTVGLSIFEDTAWYNNQPDGLIYVGKVAYEYKGTMPSNTSIQIKEDTIGIGDYAFDNYTNLSSITIPESVTTIGQGAFSNCTSLSSITIPESVTTIGERAFLNCTSLGSIVIPDSVSRIEKDTFSGCTNLKNITISKNVTYIGEAAFANCTKLSNIIIWQSVNELGYRTFQGWKDTQNINIEANKVPSEWHDNWNYGCSANIVYAYTGE